MKGEGTANNLVMRRYLVSGALKLLKLCLAVIAVLFSGVAAWTQDSFFKGKAIQIIVGYPTGGGVDTEARLLAKYIERHLPGNPAVTVRNMPGAAGLIAANWFEQFAKPDGLHLHYGSSTSIVEQAFAREEVKYNLLNWDLVGAILRGAR
jgi:tripartite-type tricarboxylate transporter receptor subunit TctC